MLEESATHCRTIPVTVQDLKPGALSIGSRSTAGEMSACATGSALKQQSLGVQGFTPSRVSPEATPTSTLP